MFCLVFFFLFCFQQLDWLKEKRNYSRLIQIVIFSWLINLVQNIMIVLFIHKRRETLKFHAFCSLYRSQRHPVQLEAAANLHFFMYGGPRKRLDLRIFFLLVFWFSSCSFFCRLAFSGLFFLFLSAFCFAYYFLSFLDKILMTFYHNFFFLIRKDA